MIIFKNIRGMTQTDGADRHIAIVRSLKNKSPWMEQMAELSPDKSLFYAYLDMKNTGEWNETAFREIYVPRFLKQIKQDKQAVAALNGLYVESKTKTIELACFCADEKLCHRSIIAGLMRGANAAVQTEHGDGSEYIDYYRQYKEI